MRIHRYKAVRRIRNPRIERLFIIAWILIAIKSVVVVWAVGHYHIPFSPLWVIVPTVVFKLPGHAAMGPSGVRDQSVERRRAPVSPPPSSHASG